MIPASGRILAEDGTTVNIVDILNAAGNVPPISNQTQNINAYAPRSGRVLGEDGKMYNLIDLLRAYVSGGTGGVTAHGELAGREDANQHPVSAINGLQDELERIENEIPNVTGFATTTELEHEATARKAALQEHDTRIIKNEAQIADLRLEEITNEISLSLAATAPSTASLNVNYFEAFANKSNPKNVFYRFSFTISKGSAPGSTNSVAVIGLPFLPSANTRGQATFHNLLILAMNECMLLSNGALCFVTSNRYVNWNDIGDNTATFVGTVSFILLEDNTLIDSHKILTIKELDLMRTNTQIQLTTETN